MILTNILLHFCLLRSMGCHIKIAGNSGYPIPFHQSPDLIYWFSWTTFCLTPVLRHDRTSFKADNWKLVWTQMINHHANNCWRGACCFTWLQLMWWRRWGWTSRFWQWNALTSDFSHDWGLWDSTLCTWRQAYHHTGQNTYTCSWIRRWGPVKGNCQPRCLLRPFDHWHPLKAVAWLTAIVWKPPNVFEMLIKNKQHWKMQSIWEMAMGSTRYAWLRKWDTFHQWI